MCQGVGFDDVPMGVCIVNLVVCSHVFSCILSAGTKHRPCRSHMHAHTHTLTHTCMHRWQAMATCLLPHTEVNIYTYTSMHIHTQRRVSRVVDGLLL